MEIQNINDFTINELINLHDFCLLNKHVSSTMEEETALIDFENFTDKEIAEQYPDGFTSLMVVRKIDRLLETYQEKLKEEIILRLSTIAGLDNNVL